jgi:hypothetical protein
MIGEVGIEPTTRGSQSKKEISIGSQYIIR